MNCHLYCGVTQVSTKNIIISEMKSTQHDKSTRQYKSAQHNRWNQRSTGVVTLGKTLYTFISHFGQAIYSLQKPSLTKSLQKEPQNGYVALVCLDRRSVPGSYEFTHTHTKKNKTVFCLRN